jgi:hypothetical protein
MSLSQLGFFDDVETYLYVIGKLVGNQFLFHEIERTG